MKRKLAMEKTSEEREATSKQEVHDFFENLKRKSREREEAERKKIDPAKLRYFIQMQEETKRKVLLNTDYDRSLVKSLRKKRRGGSPNSYIEQTDMSTSSSDAKKQQTYVPMSSTYVASGLNAEE